MGLIPINRYSHKLRFEVGRAEAPFAKPKSDRQRKNATTPGDGAKNLRRPSPQTTAIAADDSLAPGVPLMPQRTGGGTGAPLINF